MQVVSDWMLGLSWNQEVTWDHACSWVGRMCLVFTTRTRHWSRVDSPDSDFKSTLQQVTLMDELIESMLSVSSRLPPHYWSSVVVHTCSMIGNVLSIGLHVSLVWTKSQSVKVINKRLCAAIICLMHVFHQMIWNLHHKKCFPVTYFKIRHVNRQQERCKIQRRLDGILISASPELLYSWLQQDLTNQCLCGVWS